MPLKIRSVDTKAQAPIVPLKCSDTVSKRTLNSDRQKKLESILQKEALKTKAEQLKVLLIKKFTFKYGKVNQDTIKYIIGDFVNNNNAVTSEDMQKLERKIQTMTSQSKSSNLCMNTEAEYRSEEGSNQAVEKVGPATNDSKTTNDKPTAAIAKGVEWQIIATYNKLVSDEMETRAREKAVQSRLKFKDTLDQHVQLAKELKKSDNIDEIKYSHHVQSDVQKFRLEEDRKRNEMKEKNLELWRQRKEQCDEQQRLREEEKVKSRIFEKKMITTAEEKLIREKQIILESRLRDREIRMKIERDNVENKKVKKQLTDKEREEDQRLMQEYAAKLDREAYERDNAFKKRMEHIDRTSLVFSLEGAGKAAFEEQRAREALQMKELEFAIKREQEEFQRKEDERKRNLQRMLEDNRKLISSHDQEKRQEIELKERIANKYKEDQEKLQRELEEEKKTKLRMQQRYNEILEQQLNERRQLSIQNDEMVDNERKFNQKMLAEALSKGEILQQISDKLKPTQASETAKVNMSPI